MKKIALLKSEYDLGLYTKWLERTNSKVEVFDSWADSLEQANQIIIDNHQKLSDFDLLVFAGGADINPSYFGHPLSEAEKIKYRTKWPENYRDYIEHQSLKSALELKKPVFGICRGMQFVNYCLGGSLYFDIKEQTNSDRHNEYEDWRSHYHDIQFDQDSWFFKKLNTSKVQAVASRHHQAVREIAPSLQVVAKSNDGIVEILESKDPTAKIILVQFHPEYSHHEGLNIDFTDQILSFLESL